MEILDARRVRLYFALPSAYDPLLGKTKDHAQWPVGDFDTVPGFGFQVRAAATAADLGIVTRGAARQLARKSINTLLQAPREPSSRWLPHWLQDDQRHPASDFSTVDTALTYISALQGASALGLTQERDQLRLAVKALDFKKVTDQATNEISHGIDKDGQVIPFTWTAWGGETALVELLRVYKNPALPILQYDRFPPAFCGRGFITELTALFVPQFGASGSPNDRYGVNWFVERMSHLGAQRAAGRRGFFGLSPAEVISGQGATSRPIRKRQS